MRLGEVYRPEDVAQRRGRSASDLTPGSLPHPMTPTSLEAILRDIEALKGEIAKIKLALRAHGITVD